MWCRVTQQLQSAHLPDHCALGCKQEHAFHYVRISAKSLSIVSQPHADDNKRPGKLEMVLDLHPRLFCSSAQLMLSMDADSLQDCWLLLTNTEPSGPQNAVLPTAGSQHSKQTVASRGRGRGCGRAIRRWRHNRDGKQAPTTAAASQHTTNENAESMYPRPPRTRMTTPQETNDVTAGSLPMQTIANRPRQTGPDTSVHSSMHAAAMGLSQLSRQDTLKQAQDGTQDDNHHSQPMQAAPHALDMQQPQHVQTIYEPQRLESVWAEACLAPGVVVWATFGKTSLWPARLVSMGPTAGSASVVLFGNSLKTEVPANSLTPFQQDCAVRCARLHSELGQKVRVRQC